MWCRIYTHISPNTTWTISDKNGTPKLPAINAAASSSASSNVVEHLVNTAILLASSLLPVFGERVLRPCLNILHGSFTPIVRHLHCPQQLPSGEMQFQHDFNSIPALIVIPCTQFCIQCRHSRTSYGFSSFPSVYKMTMSSIWSPGTAKRCSAERSE